MVLGGIVEHLKMIFQHARNCVLKLSSRLTNHVAHRLAKIGHSLSFDVLWFNSSHPLVLEDSHVDWIHNK